MQTKQLAETIWPRARREIIGLLFTHPGEEWHLRDIARITDLAPATVQREAVSLSEAGILTRRSSGRQVLYGADTSCPIFQELRGIAIKTVGIAAPIRESLEEMSDRIEFGFIFGSMAAGSARPDSDIDVMLVGDVSLRDLVPILRELEDTLGREVNPVTMQIDEFKRRVGDDEAFVRRILGEPKIFLFGDDNELARVSGSRSVTPT